MFAITGITGQVGGEVARNLLAAHQGVARDVSKCKEWAERGCVLVSADINNAAALATAFKGVDGAFVLVPPNFDPSPDFSKARAIAANLSSALVAAARVESYIYRRSGAGNARKPADTAHYHRASAPKAADGNHLSAASMVHGELHMGCCSGEERRDSNFLQPLDKPFPMVATSDIGRLAAELLQETSDGQPVVELEGPHRVTPTEVAATFASLLGRPVRVEAVPRGTWEGLFKSQGMKNPEPPHSDVR